MTTSTLAASQAAITRAKAVLDERTDPTLEALAYRVGQLEWWLSELIQIAEARKQ
jgi:hypothetical protein